MHMPAASALNLDPLLAAALTGVTALVAWLQRRGAWRWGRAGHIIALAAAVAILGLAWLSPLATLRQTVGGRVVALAHQVLYPVYASAPRVLGLDALTDQQIAGASIALVSKIALLTAFVIVFIRLLESGPAEADDEGGGGGG